MSSDDRQEEIVDEAEPEALHCRECGRQLGEFWPLPGAPASCLPALCDQCLDPSEDEPEELIEWLRVGRANATPLSSFRLQRIDWLWTDRVPFGMVTLLIGDPGLGKSLLSMWLAAKVTDAGRDVLLLCAEDHPAITLQPRALAAGADVDRLHIVTVRRDDDGDDEGLLLPDDGDKLAELARMHTPGLIVVDPLAAHLPSSVNSWRDQDVRRALGPLHRIAEQHRCAVLVVAHLNKATGAQAIYRTGGSIGLPAAARSALLLARDPEDRDGDRGTGRVLAHVKSNVGRLASALLLDVKEAITADGVSTAKVDIVGVSAATTDELLSPPPARDHTERDDAVEFLKAELEDGPQPVKSIKTATADAGLKWRTIERAKAELGVQATRSSTGNTGKGQWLWALPSASPPTARPTGLSSPGGGLADHARNEPVSSPLDRKTATGHRLADLDGRSGHGAEE